MWHAGWGGLPEEDFLITLDPLLTGFRSRLFEDTFTADKSVGTLSPEWAGRLGLTTNVVVAEAPSTAIWVPWSRYYPHTFVRVIGTSTCDIMVAPTRRSGLPLSAVSADR